MPQHRADWVEYDKGLKAGFARTVQSLIDQGLPNWELCIGLKLDQVATVKEWLDTVTQAMPKGHRLRQQIRLISAAEQLEHPTNQTKAAFSYSDRDLFSRMFDSSKGQWLGFVMVGDVLAPHYVYEVLKVALTQDNAQFMTFDDDVLELKPRARIFSKRHTPHFKPDFSLDLLYCQNYIGLSFATRKSILKYAFMTVLQTQARLATNFSYQLVLACVAMCVEKFGLKVGGGSVTNLIKSDQLVGQEGRGGQQEKQQGRRSQTAGTGTLTSSKRLAAVGSRLHPQFPMVHVPAVLRHRDLNSAQAQRHELSASAQRSEQSLVNGFFKYLGLKARAKVVSPGLMQVLWPLPQRRPSVTLIIPTKDQPGILKTCINSILSNTAYPNFDVIVVDNQTSDQQALKYLASVQAKHGNVQVVRNDQPFNFSAINNEAVAMASGEVLVLMNNDVQVTDGQWLDAMVRHAIRPDVGCVGAKLLFPDRTIQHGGVAVGMHGVADHMFRALRETPHNDPYRHLQSTRNPQAVTAAVLAIRKSLFKALGGLDAKRFKVAFNDVDLCLKAEEAGYRCVWTPLACLIHHESKTRAPKAGGAGNADEPLRERREIQAMKTRWGPLLKQKQQALSTRYAQLRYL